MVFTSFFPALLIFFLTDWLDLIFFLTDWLDLIFFLTDWLDLIFFLTDWLDLIFFLTDWLDLIEVFKRGMVDFTIPTSFNIFVLHLWHYILLPTKL